jgi:hypothetical protein
MPRPRSLAQRASHRLKVALEMITSNWRMINPGKQQGE